MNKKKKFLIRIILVVFLATIIFSFWQKPVLAQGLAATTGDVLIKTGTTLSNIIALIISWVLWLPMWAIGKFSLVIIEVLVQVAQFNKFINIGAVSLGWQTMRDICNMFFIIILLVIAFGTVLQAPQWNYRQLLGRLILAAVLINFSKMICGLLIDAGQVIMMTFVNAFKDTMPGVLANATGFDKMLSMGKDVVGNITNIATGGTMILNMIFITVSFITILSIFLVLVVRVVMLWFLVVFSPIVWVGNLVPITAKYASQWWEQFTKWIIIGPILAFFLWFSLLTFQSVDIAKEIKEGLTTTTSKEAIGITAVLSELSSSENTLNYAFAVVMLLMSLVFATQLGGKAAGAVVGWATGKAGPSPMRWARERYQSYQAKRVGARKEGVEEFAGGMAALRDKILPGLLPGARRRAGERVMKNEQEIVGRMDWDTLRNTGLNSRDKYRQAAAAQRMMAEGFIKEDSPINRTIVNLAFRNLRDVPTSRAAFEERVMKTNSALAGATIFEGFGTPQQRERFQAAIASGKMDLGKTVKELTETMINSLRAGMTAADPVRGQSAFDQWVINSAKDPDELKRINKGLTKDRQDLLFGRLNHNEIAAGITDPREREAFIEKAAKGAGRYVQLWNLADSREQARAIQFIKENKEDVKKDVNLGSLIDANFQRVLTETMSKGDLRDIWKDKDKRRASVAGLKVLVNSYGTDYKSDPAKASRQNLVVASRGSAVLTAYNPIHGRPAINAFIKDIATAGIKGEDLGKLDASTLSPKYKLELARSITPKQLIDVLNEGNPDLIREVRKVFEDPKVRARDPRIEKMYKRIRFNDWFNI